VPAAAALTQARLQQAAVCLQLAQADARHATADAAAKRPKYPRVPEKDAAVVEGYVDGEVQQAQEARKEQQDEVGSSLLHLDASGLLRLPAAQAALLGTPYHMYWQSCATFGATCCIQHHGA
jgi:hypothetical protein